MEDSLNREGFCETDSNMVPLNTLSHDDQNIFKQKNTDILSSVFQVISGSSSEKICKGVLSINNLRAGQQC